MSHTYQLPTEFCHTNDPFRWHPSRLVDLYIFLLLQRPQQQQHMLLQHLQPAAAIPAAAHLLDLLSICHPKGAKMRRLARAFHATAGVLIHSRLDNDKHERK